jgi:hypothetical protein
MNPDDLRKRLMTQKNTSNSTPTEPESPMSGALRAQELKRRFGAEPKPETPEPLPWEAPENVPAAIIPARAAGAQLPARSLDSDGFAEVAASRMATTSDIAGMILKYKRDGFYTRDDICVPLGTRLVVRAMRGPLWEKWEGGKKVDRREGSPLPLRRELGDLDSSKWETGPNGQKKDHWQHTDYVYLINLQTGEIFTFITSTWGGSEAAKQLAVHVETVRQNVPGALPVVELATTTKKSPKWGPVPAPLFVVKGWVDCDLRPISLGDEIDDAVSY